MSTTVLPTVDAETAARAGLAEGLNGHPFNRVRVNGAEVAYVEEGTGQPVVSVHGDRFAGPDGCQWIPRRRPVCQFWHLSGAASNGGC